MPIMPNFVERLILLKLNLGPGAMLDDQPPIIVPPEKLGFPAYRMVV
jgi:hypothetical protein